MKIYGLSGLGADERAFNILNTHLQQPIIPISWIPPIAKENLSEYSQRIAERIGNSEKIGLAGVSFGGMIAVEISKHIKVEKIILISSAASKYELPQKLILPFTISLLKLVPAKYMLPPISISQWFFGIKNAKSKQLLLEIMRDTDTDFVKWAVSKIISWDNTFVPENIIRIHGNLDRVIPISKNINYHIIKDSGHFAIVDNAREIAEIINKEMYFTKLDN